MVPHRLDLNMPDANKLEFMDAASLRAAALFPGNRPPCACGTGVLAPDGRAGQPWSCTGCATQVPDQEALQRMRDQYDRG